MIKNASGSTLYVNTTGSGGAYTSIQNAINSSSHGDTVYVVDGTYVGNVVVNKTINLIGEERDTTLIDGGGSGYAVQITADGVNMSGFTVKNSGGANPGILIKSNNNSISDNKVRNNYYGIFLSHSNGNNITFNTVQTSDLDGIYLNSSNENRIYGNTASSNSVAGIYIRSSTLNNVTNNFAMNNEWGIYVYNSTNIIISGNTFSNNSFNGIHLYYSDENTVINNTVSRSDNFGMRIKHSENNVITRNTVEYNVKGLCLSYAKYNLIFHNNLISNTEQATDTVGYKNQWNNSYLLGGNYWSDYIGSDNFKGPNQSISGSDNIGDTPYIIEIPSFDDLIDNYPLMSPYSFSPITPQIKLLSPGNNSLIQAGEHLDFQVEDDNLCFAYYIINEEEDIQFYSPFNIPTSGWTDGNYSIEIFALDPSMNSNSSWYFFTIDSTPPSVEYNSTLIDSTIPAGKTIQLNISDPHLISVVISIDRGEYSVFSAPYIIDTFNWTDGIHAVSVKANDILGNEVSKDLNISIDAIHPFVISTTPANSSKNIEINTTITLTFSEQMNQTNVENYVFLYPTDPLINYTLYWDASGTVLTVSFPLNNLTRGTTYKLVIDSHIIDINSTPMASDFVLEFTTVTLDSEEVGFLDSEIFGISNKLLLLVLLVAVIISAILMILFFKRKKVKMYKAEQIDEIEKLLPPPKDYR